MGKKVKTPPPPDPYATAAAQTASNVETAKTQARLNAIDTYSPYGNVYFERDSEGVPIAQRLVLSPGQQRLYNTESDIANTLADQARYRAGLIPQTPFSLASAPDLVTSVGPSDFSEDRRRVEESVFNRGRALLDPVFQQQSQRLEQRLADQGIPLETNAYSGATGDLRRAQNEAYMNLANDAIMHGGAEQSRLLSDAISRAAFANDARSRAINDIVLERNQPFNELAAYLQGSPALNQPQGAPIPQTGVSPTDVTGAVYNSYNAALQRAALQQQQRSNLLSGLFGLGAAAIL